MPTKPEDKAVAITVANPGRTSTRQTFRAPSGMFQKRPHAPSPLAVQQATAAILTAVSPEKPKSDYELMVEAMTQLAQNPTEKTASAAVKAFEALTKAAGFQEKAIDRQPSFTIVLTMPDLPNSGEYIPVEKREPLRPNFTSADEQKYLEAEIVSTNSAPTAPEPPKEKPTDIKSITAEWAEKLL
jgi:hypothetical protein